MAERKVTDSKEIATILEQCQILFLSFNNDPAPYVVPLFFGHEPGRLYAHSARVGTKIELMLRDPYVGFSAVAAAEIIEGRMPCNYTARTQSVAGTGAARLVTNEAEILHGLNLIMQHYAAGRTAEGFSYNPASLGRTAVIAIDIHAMTAKRIGPE